jgi:hypothetical protein
MELSNGFTKELRNSVLQNYATVKWNAGDILLVGTTAPCYIDNFGLWEATTDDKMLNGIGLFDRAFYNKLEMATGQKGVFSKTGGAGGETEFEVRLHNDGILKKNNRKIVWDPAKYTGDGTVEE